MCRVGECGLEEVVIFFMDFLGREVGGAFLKLFVFEFFIYVFS